MTHEINIFQFENYRLFLKAKFEEYKKNHPDISSRKFAKMAGFGSPSYFNFVVEAKRNLTDKTIDRFIKIFELNKDEAFYFKNLVFLNQATNIEERQVFAKQVLKSRGFKKTNPLADYQHHYFTRWYFVAIRELIALPDFHETPKWIAKRLFDLVSPEDAKQAVDELLKLHVIQRNADGKLVQVQDFILTADEVTSPFAALYHDQMIKLASDAIKFFPREAREISGLTFRISKNNLKSIKELMQRFYKEMVSILLEGEKEANCVYQFNQQLFPLALPPEDIDEPSPKS